MYLEELIIEGFKSYVSRTHITGWDSEFNAITGLNGSGKSNVLDAICFVLGITNLSQVRASNLQDLIYKRGQAGVTKASVTIVLNNENKDTSPVGFDAYRQITVTRQVLMGGRTKYIMNGHNTQQQTVQNLFQSVSLNINNPHFLIMQGRITKVLNMKPQEILSMVEEAAGTRMFEDRKNKAFQTMAKKERTVEEINKLILEEITPRLERLRAEKRVYLDFQKTESEMERLNRMVVAHEYSRYDERLNQSGADNTARQLHINGLKETIQALKAEMKAIEIERNAVTEKQKQNSANGSKLRELEVLIKQYSTQLVRYRIKVELQENSIADEQKKMSNLTSSKGKMERTLSEKKESHAKIRQEFEDYQKDHDEKKKEMQRISELIQTLTTGISAEEGHENGYMEQLQHCKNADREASTAEDTARLRITHLNKELAEKEPQAVNAQRQNYGLIEEIAFNKKQVAHFEKELSTLNWNPEQGDRLNTQRAQAEAILRSYREQKDDLSRQLSRLDFVYSNPTPDFDRSKVKGLVVDLISLDKEKFDAATALEICAKGRLYNVIVEDEVVGAQLLDKGRLQHRCTLIPLNRIQGSVASAEQIARAKKLAPGKVDLALSLIRYEKDVEAAMEWIFGNTLICKDAETAELVTFDKDVNMKSITLDGDVYDPFGTLTGGSKPSSSGILIKVQEMKGVSESLRQQEEVYDKLKKEWVECQESMDQYKQCKQRLDLQAHEVLLLEDRLSKSMHAQLLEQVKEIKQQIENYKASVVEAQKDRAKAVADYKRIEKEMNEFNDNKDSKLSEMTKNVEHTKLQLSHKSQKLQDMQRAVQTLQLEIDQLETDIGACEQNIVESCATIHLYKQTAELLRQDLEQSQSLNDQTQVRIEQETEALNAHNTEIQEFDALHKCKSSQVVEYGLEVQKITHEMERHQKEQQSAQQMVNDLENQYEWIVDQKQLFGQPNTPYDYKNISMSDTKRTLAQLATKYDTMRKKINVRVMSMIDNDEKKETALNQRLATVQRDKHKIEDTVKTVEQHKKETLERTWQKVNKDFSDIFADLLPGNTCKLQAPQGKDISDGLEVKVCIGGVWKQSLSELSGGQKSLVALSLILSLLQYKPAPMYILDEVDAALDLSHTQNIGQLLKTRFKGSQFIVVSLKEGMFNNANVIFKTHFKDGTSVVERITGESIKQKENSITLQRKRQR
ncbi:RecF/RecN/SMC [Spinellus fusiger]|nr:RecF/RecN/SMC [Spinellus fusiger]